MIALSVPYAQRHEAKALGARWSPEQRAWMIEEDADRSLFTRWLPDAPPAPPEAPMVDAGPAPGVPLSAFLARIGAVIRRELSEPVWVMAEVLEGARARSGLRGDHLYLDLGEVADGKVVAKVAANAFHAAQRTWFRHFVETVGQPPQAGMRLLLQVVPRYDPQYGLSLAIQSIDPAFTLGDLAAQLQALTDRLMADGTATQQQRHRLPFDYTRIAVIAPPDAAGLGDFNREIGALQSAGALVACYYPATFSGPSVAASLMQAIRAVEGEHCRDPFDVVVVLRGGGARADLAQLNIESVARALAALPLPVFTALGHLHDHTLLDTVARLKHDTPSKASAFILSTARARADAVAQALDQVARAGHARTEFLASRLIDRFRLATSAATARIASTERGVTRSAMHTHQTAQAKAHATLSQLDRGFHRTAASAMARVGRVEQRLQGGVANVGRVGHRWVDHSAATLLRQAAAVGMQATRNLDRAEHHLRLSLAQIDAADPRRILQRGYALVQNDAGQVVTRAAQVAGPLTLRWLDGTVNVAPVRSPPPVDEAPLSPTE